MAAYKSFQVEQKGKSKGENKRLDDYAKGSTLMS